MRTLRWLCVVFALVVAIGPAATVQGLGWLGMLATRVASQSVTEAVQSTFDGSAPCALCSAASDLMQVEKGDDGKGNPSPERSLKTIKMEMIAVVPEWFAATPQDRMHAAWPACDGDVALRGVEPTPELPPPRA